VNWQQNLWSLLGHATGGMFVPFAAHLEAWIRGETFRIDHPRDDVASVVLKGIIWTICLTCFIISLRSAGSNERLAETAKT